MNTKHLGSFGASMIRSKQTIMKTKQTFQKLPISMLGKVTPKEVYIYAKLSMLENTVYCQTAIGTTPTSKIEEMNRHTVAKAINGLEEKGFISITKIRLEGNRYDSNVYTLLPFEGYFKGVYNDFINLETIGADVKGFAILLHLYGLEVASMSALSKVTGVSDKSCKKYIEALKTAGILVDGYLTDKYFPRLQREAVRKEFEGKVEQLTSIEFNEATKAYIKRCVDTLTKQALEGKITYKFAIERLIDVENGLFWNKKEEKGATNNVIL